MPIRKKFTSRPLRELLPALTAGDVSLNALMEEISAAAQSLNGTRAYAHFDAEVLARRAATLRPGPGAPLFGLPVSVKDLMSVAGEPTTCGSAFYTEVAGLPEETAPFVSDFEARGALLAGKTTLNEFAYGITGDNPWFGDCTIPGFPGRLTGGSSSGAAASVVGGAACVALGTDTGGSLRVPAALCGLVSLRAPGWFPDHRGVFPLAPSFDALGWLQRNVGDVRMIATALGLIAGGAPVSAGQFRIGFLSGAVLNDVEPAILAAQSALQRVLETAGCAVTSIAAERWEAALELFAPLQAHEAFSVHERWLKTHEQRYSAPVLARLQWGREISRAAYEDLQTKRVELVEEMSRAFAVADLLVLPATPMTALRCGEDQSVNRPRILRLTAPASLGNWPVLTVPWRQGEGISGIGFQVIAPRGNERLLVEFSDVLGRHLPGESPDTSDHRQA